MKALLLSAMLAALPFAFWKSNSSSFTGTFFVASTGSDANNGFTTGTPFLTLGKAQTAVQAKLASQSQNITVSVVGTLPIASALALTSADNPKNGFKVTWGGGTLFAGNYVTNWTAVGASMPGAYKAAYTGPSVRSITFNGERRFRVRNGQFLPALTLTAGGYTGATGTALAGEPNATNVEFIYQIYQFSEGRNVVTNITGNTVNMLSGTHLLLTRTWGTNAVLTDIENLWNNFTNYARQMTFYDDTAHSLIYYYPRPTENMATAVVTVPNEMVESAITMNGVTNVTLSGIGVAETAWDIHKNGFASVAQGMYWKLGVTTNQTMADGNTNLLHVPGAIYLNDCTNCNVVGCWITNCDSAGLTRTFGCNGCNAIANVIQDVAYNGLTIGEWSECTNAVKVYCTACNTVSNYINGCGKLAAGACGVCQPFAKNTHVDYNTITEIPYVGVAFGIGLDGHTNIQATIGGDTICSNRIIDTMQLEVDGGAIYSQAPTAFGGAGLVIWGNYISRTRRYAIPYGGTSYPTAGVYCDAGSSGVTVVSNIFDNIAQAVFWNNANGEPNAMLVNYSDSSVVGYNTTHPSPDTAPTVTQFPAWNQPGIANAAGAGALVPSSFGIPWDFYVASLAPVVWYKNNDSTTTMVDFSGNNLSATLSGAYTQGQAQFAPGITRSPNTTTLYSGGVATSSANSQVSVGLTPFSTVSLVRPNITRSGAFNSYQVQSALGNSPQLPGWLIYNFWNGVSLNPNNSVPPCVDIYSDATTPAHIAVIGGTDLTNGGPWLIVSTWTGADNPADLKLYVNGSYEVPCAVANTLGGPATSTNPLKLGNGYPGGEGDMLFFNYVLTPREIHNLALAAGVNFK